MRPTRPAIEVWPGRGSWHLRSEGQGLTVRYALPGRGEQLHVLHFTLSPKLLRSSKVAPGESLRALIAKRLREARAKRAPA